MQIKNYNAFILYRKILEIEANAMLLAHIYTWPLTFLAWYKHFNNSKGVYGVCNGCVSTYVLVFNTYLLYK
jgi:hypothetical protein